MNILEWSGIQSGDDIDSGDTDVGGSLTGLLASERQLSAAGSRARWRVLTTGYQGRLARLRFIEVDHAPGEIRIRLRKLGHLAALIDQTRPWRGLAGMPPILQAIRVWVEENEERALAELPFAERLRAAFSPLLHNQLEECWTPWKMARAHLRATRRDLRRVRRSLRAVPPSQGCKCLQCLTTISMEQMDGQIIRRSF